MSSSERQTEVLRAQLLSKAVLHPDETELYELTQLAGVTMDPQVFKIILDLLKLNVPPVAVIQTLRSMCSPHHHNDIKTTSASQKHEESHPHVTIGRGDTSQDMSRHPRGSRPTSGDHRTRPAGVDNHERSAGSERYTKSAVGDGKSYTSYSSSNITRDNTTSRTSSRQQTRPASEMYGSYGSRTNRSTSPSGRADTFVTSRQKNSTLNDGSYREKDKTVKKRSSYHH